MMVHPPGLVYLFRRLDFFLFPPIAVYFALKIGGRYLSFSIPTWIVVVSILLARPLLSFARNKYNDSKDERAAAARGAVLPPCVRETSFTVARKGLKGLERFPGDLMADWAREYGYTYMISRFTSQTLVTYDPEIIKAFLSTQFESFDKGPQFRAQFESLLGSGVFNVDGEMWKFHRAMTRPFFTRERISDFDIYDKNCDISLNLARRRLREGYPVEFQDLVRRFTLDSASEFLFGHNVDSLSAGIPYPPYAEHKNPPSFNTHSSNIFSRAFGLAQYFATSRISFGDDWPLAEFWKDKILEERKVMDSFTEPLMRAALAQKENLKFGRKGDRDDDDEEDPTVLSHLVRQTQDPNVIKDELVNLLVAGRDTTAALLTFSMYMLAEHADVERRLREEVLEKVGPTNRPTYNDMREMRYMRAFLNEVLRLYPPVPLNTRRSNNPVVVTPKNPNEQPMYIPANTDCIYGVINVHRRTDLWGPDACKFDPNRFLDERIKYLTSNPFIFCPFNAGPRICLGQQLAYNEASFFLIRLLQRFAGFKLDSSSNIKPPTDWATGIATSEKVVSLSHLTIYVKGGLWIYMTESGPE